MAIPLLMTHNSRFFKIILIHEKPFHQIQILSKLRVKIDVLLNQKLSHVHHCQKIFHLTDISNFNYAVTYFDFFESALDNIFVSRFNNEIVLQFLMYLLFVLFFSINFISDAFEKYFFLTSFSPKLVL